MVITRHTAAVYWRNVNYIHRNIQSPLTELQLTLRQGAERDLTQWVNVTLQGRVTDISYKQDRLMCFFFFFSFTLLWTFIIEYLPVTSVFVYVFFHITAGQHTDTTVTIHQRPRRPVFSAFSEEQYCLTNRTSLYFFFIRLYKIFLHVVFCPSLCHRLERGDVIWAFLYKAVCRNV